MLINLQAKCFIESNSEVKYLVHPSIRQSLGMFNLFTCLVSIRSMNYRIQNMTVNWFMLNAKILWVEQQ
ncbi:unnamed protein product [Schistosoma spindalis]|nr:unnamed protein product [Schistosoma spindale]